MSIERRLIEIDGFYELIYERMIYYACNDTYFIF